MRIKVNTDKPLISNTAPKRKRLVSWVLKSSAIALLFVLFLGILNYGAYLKKIEQTGYFRQALIRTLKFDFSFIKNYADGRLTNLDEIKLDIKFKHLIRLNYLREQALQGEFISDAFKNEEFPANLTFNGESQKVKIGMTGKMVRGHLRNPNKWSFQVRVKGDNTIGGMKRFGLLIPESRGFLTDWLALHLLNDRGLISLRSNLVDVSINGKPTGVFYLEERFDKHLIENNRLREGIIFKIEEDLHPYKESKLMLNPGTRDQLLALKRMWLDVMEGKLAPQRFFDMEKLAKLFAISDLMNNKHPLVRENLRFYFNPVTNLAEPIAREFQNVEKNDPAKLALFLEKPDQTLKLPRWHIWLSHDRVNRLIFDNLEFKRLYLQEAAIISQKEFLDDFFHQHKDEIDHYSKRMYRMWPFYDFPAQKLYENQAYMRSVLFPAEQEIAARVIRKTDNYLSLQLQNQQYIPVEVRYLSWQDSIIFHPEKEVVIDSKAKMIRAEDEIFRFRIPADVSASEDLLNDLKIHYRFPGLQTGEKTAMVQPLSPEWIQGKNPMLSERKEGHYLNVEFLKEKGNTLYIPAGNWTLTEDLIIPPGKQLMIAAGAKIDQLNHAKIISYSAVSSIGHQNKPIRIHSSDGTGEGLRIIRANGRSNFSNTHFEGIGQAEAPTATGIAAVTFYESPVTIKACRFTGQSKNAPFLAINRTDFLIDLSTFTNISTSAIECQHCTGEVSNTSFINIGADGLNIIGARAEVDLTNVFMNTIGNRAISATENSQLVAKWIEIRGAKVGIAGTDQAKIALTDTQMLNTEIGISLLQARQGYGPALMKAERISIQQSEIPHLLEEHAKLTLDGKPVPTNKEMGEEKVYRAEFGKSSQ